MSAEGAADSYRFMKVEASGMLGLQRNPKQQPMCCMPMI
jgi:hypothetical protein